MSQEFTVPKIKAVYDEATSAINGANDAAALEDVKNKYLGRKGLINGLFSEIGKVPNEEKKAFGQELNQLKNAATTAWEAKIASLNESTDAPLLFDYSKPGLEQGAGASHILTSTIREISSIFETLGFQVCEGPEVETPFYNFDGLNIPENHPARDFKDNFYLADDLLLRSQTSTVQIRVMEESNPPFRFISPGRVYRPDAVDATHYFMFHQIEGVAVDENVTFGDMKYVLNQFVKGFFGNDIKTRMRPHFFPFTEPSAEIDITCIICGGKGCNVCKYNGWLEVLGCGIIDPNVFTSVNVDAKKYQGFAFGMGVERIAMLKHGINDIRLFYENDLRFLKQFKG